jgi:hypothetical protein
LGGYLIIDQAHQPLQNYGLIRLNRRRDRNRLYRIGHPPTSATCLGVFA